MRTAVIAFIPENHVLGQSIGCIVPLKRAMKLNRLIRVCDRLTRGRSLDLVSLNFISAHTDIPGSCISLACHFASVAVDTESLAHRIVISRNWVLHEFGVHDVLEKTFPSRIEFCHYMREPLTVM